MASNSVCAGRVCLRVKTANAVTCTWSSTSNCRRNSARKNARCGKSSAALRVSTRVTPNQENIMDTLQLFELDPQAVYTIEETAHLANVPRHRIAIYYKYGLVSPAMA